MRRRRFENVAVGDRLHRVHGAGRDPKRFAFPELHVLELVAPRQFDSVDHLARQEVNGLVFPVVVLLRQRFASIHVQDLADVLIGSRPDDLVAPRFRHVSDGDTTRERVAHRIVLGHSGLKYVLGSSLAPLLLCSPMMILAPRYLPRLAATVGLFTRYGLGDFADRNGLRGLVAEEEESGGNGSSPEKAVAFRKRLVELGPAYIKLGQVLSTRPDLIPETYVHELEKLQDEVPPIPFDQVEQVIESELGGRMSKLFEEFEREPLGTASLGQVHAAVLRGNRDVVVKVQRPNIRKLLADDLEFFRELAGFMTKHTQMGARVDMLGIITQLERALLDELDYRIEARNSATFRRALAEFPRLLVPRVIEGYTTERVLTTDRVRGLKIDDVSPLVRMEHDFEPLAEELTRAYLKTIIIDGHFHADPHPGNFFVILPESDNPLTPAELKAIDRRAEAREAGTHIQRIEQEAQKTAPVGQANVDVKLALIDFGMTARLSTKMRERIVTLLMAIADNRGDEAAEIMVGIG